MPIRLWHDDVRPAPPGWVWARTNEEALDVLRSFTVVECSLDHDLGYHDVELPEDPDELAEVLILRGQAEETGYDLVLQMIREDIVPQKVHIHSWNPDGARRMFDTLAQETVSTISVAPYPQMTPFAALGS